MPNKIVVRDLAIIYRGRHDHEPVLACNGVDLEVEEGAFVSIVGPSGCGKTTLLYAIDGLLPINQGEIRVNGNPIHGPGIDRAMHAAGPPRHYRTNGNPLVNLVGELSKQTERNSVFIQKPNFSLRLEKRRTS